MEKLGGALSRKSPRASDPKGDDDSPEAHKERKERWQNAFKAAKLQKMKASMDKKAATKPILFVFHMAALMLMYLIVVHTIPIENIAKAGQGIDAFVNDMVNFAKLDGSDGSLDVVTTLDDAVAYSEALVTALLTTKSYRGSRQPDEELMLLRVHRLINAVVFTQRRVNSTDCSYKVMRGMYKRCYEGLQDGEELREGSAPLKLTTGDEIYYSAERDGFGVDLPLDQESAVAMVKNLRKGRYWDRATREFSIMFAFHNSPGHFTGNVRVTFELSAFGYIKHRVEKQFLRLRPYSEQTHGTHLVFLQIALLCNLVPLLGYTFWIVADQPHVRWSVAQMVRPWWILEIINYGVIITVAVRWYSFMHDARRTSLDFTSDKYQDILPLAADFNFMVFLMAISLLLMAVRSVDFVTHLGIEEFRKTSHVFEAVVENLGYFGILFAGVFLGFVLASHVLFGQYEARFMTVGGCAKSLLIWFVALGGGHRSLMEFPGGTLFMWLFIFVMMILIFNTFLAAVLTAHDEIVFGGEVNKKPSNHVFADMLCDWMHVPQFKHDPYNDAVFDAFRGLRNMNLKSVLKKEQQLVKQVTRAYGSEGARRKSVISDMPRHSRTSVSAGAARASHSEKNLPSAASHQSVPSAAPAALSEPAQASVAPGVSLPAEAVAKGPSVPKTSKPIAKDKSQPTSPHVAFETE